MHNIAIVTGASSGLGEKFARQLDQGAGGPLDEIWLIARSQEALEALSAKLQTPSRVFALDLTDTASFDAVDEALSVEKNLNVQWLVNSAGFGKFGPFTGIGAKANGNMVRLNCLAVVEMCYRCLVFMHAGSRIVNIASAAALVPQPGLSVYGATKRFVLDFSRALDAELGSGDVHVTAVCPKFMDTHFLDAPGNRESVGHFTWIGFEDADKCVSKALRGAVRGKSCVITSPDVQAMNVFCKVLPTSWVMAVEKGLGNLLVKQAK